MPSPVPGVLEKILGTLVRVLNWRFFFVLALIVSAALRFAGARIPELSPFVDKNKAWLDLAFLVSLVACAMYGAIALWRNVGLRFLNGRRVRANIRSLTVPEKHILQQFTEAHERTMDLRMDDGVVATLVEHGILRPSGVAYTHPPVCPLTMTPVAWSYLRKHPELVATPDNPRPEPTGNEWMRY